MKIPPMLIINLAAVFGTMVRHLLNTVCGCHSLVQSLYWGQQLLSDAGFDVDGTWFSGWWRMFAPCWASLESKKMLQVCRNWSRFRRVTEEIMALICQQMKHDQKKEEKWKCYEPQNMEQMERERRRNKHRTHSGEYECRIYVFMKQSCLETPLKGLHEGTYACVCVSDFPFYVTKDHAVCWKGTKRSKYSLAAFPVTQRCCFTPKQLRNKKKQSSFFVLSMQTVKNNRTNLCIFTQLSREASACSGTESPRWSSLDCSRVDLQDGMTIRNPKNCLKLFQFTYFPRVCEQHRPFSLLTVPPQTQEQTHTLSCYYRLS